MQTHAAKMTGGFAAEAPRTVVWLAVLGVLFSIWGYYGFFSWIGSPDFRPIDPGADPLPFFPKALIAGLEISGPIITAWILYYVWKTSKREGKLSFEGVLIFGYALCYWWDPGTNWFRTGFFYNSHFYNMGSWGMHIPGWVNPAARNFPEPLIAVPASWLYVALLASLFCCWAMNKAKRMWPSLGVAGLIGVACLAGTLFDLGTELIMIRYGQLWAYPAVIGNLTIWAGKTYQFPVYEALWGTLVFGPLGALYYFRDDRGYTILDRGLERVKLVKMRSLLRVFAMAGFINAMILVYQLPLWLSMFHVDTTVQNYPSYLRNGMCGEDTDYSCPAPNVPIPLSKSGPAKAYTGK